MQPEPLYLKVRLRSSVLSCGNTFGILLRHLIARMHAFVPTFATSSTCEYLLTKLLMGSIAYARYRFVTKYMATKTTTRGSHAEAGQVALSCFCYMHTNT